MTGEVLLIFINRHGEEVHHEWLKGVKEVIYQHIKQYQDKWYCLHRVMYSGKDNFVSVTYMEEVN